MKTWQEKARAKKKRLRAIRRVAPDFTFTGDISHLTGLRRGLVIPDDAGPTLLNHRRKQLAAALEAKRPHEPRLVQRAKKLAAREAAKKQRIELGKQLKKSLAA